MARLGRGRPIQALTRQYNYSIDGQFVWFAVYIIATGELYSIGTEVANPLDPSMSFVELARYPVNVLWDPITLTFGPFPPDPPVDRVADLLADGTLAAAWASLTGLESTAMQDRIGQMLGSRRYRASDEPIDL
jgi:hypothetical protein